jgi:hypothetical protein
MMIHEAMRTLVVPIETAAAWKNYNLFVSGRLVAVRNPSLRRFMAEYGGNCAGVTRLPS